MATRVTRRQFIAAGALAAALPVRGQGTSANEALSNPRDGAWARWLDAPSKFGGVTWGVPWPRGTHKSNVPFSLRDVGGSEYAVQSWPLAYWPDGSLKWTAHAAPGSLGAGPFEIVPRRKSKSPVIAIKLSESESHVEIDTGSIVCRIAKRGRNLIESISRDGRERLRAGHLVLLNQDHPGMSGDGSVRQERFDSLIERATIEQRGPIRAVVKVEGRHRSEAGRSWLPFVVRFYFYAGCESLRAMHSIVFDGDESRDFIRGIGLRFSTPLNNLLHDRHVRFAGERDGVFAEAVRGLTGLRRDPGAAARRAQLDGLPTPPPEEFRQNVGRSLELIPAFGDWTLVQASADSFAIRKRARDGFGWLQAGRGGRAPGLGFVGGPSGGVTFGIRNFWQSHPAQLDIRNATGESAEVTMWVWAPDAPPMDLRFYHDGMGQDTYDKQTAGLEITYEDYEPGFGTPVGVARTSELTLTIESTTPRRDRIVDLAAHLREPPQLVSTSQTIAESGVFAKSFSVRAGANPNPRAAELDSHLDWMFEFYKGQQDERGWYGFWNYGDVMHTYDADRHVWRYDVGGFAWDNSELSTDIWLWLYFLRSGRADAFRFAEAMTRHTGEVDVHHLGRFAPLGSRHNVQHWGCSAKQLRISTALNRRYYFYLTADERVGDLLREQLDAARTLRSIEPGRKLPDARKRGKVDPNGEYAQVGFGTDWGSLAGAWLTEWERTGSAKYRERLRASMRSIAAQPRGFFSGGSRMNVDTGAFDIKTETTASASHLSAAFGLPEVCAELVELLSVPAFERAWLQYCELYNAPADEQTRVLGNALGPLNLGQGHSRLTAFAAHRKRDIALARRAWQELFAGRAGFAPNQKFISLEIAGPQVLHPVDEAAWVSTNSAAQWGLAAIECLAWASEGLDSA